MYNSVKFYSDVPLPTLINDKYVFQANDIICTVKTLYCCGTMEKLTVCTAGQTYIKQYNKKTHNLKIKC